MATPPGKPLPGRGTNVRLGEDDLADSAGRWVWSLCALKGPFGMATPLKSFLLLHPTKKTLRALRGLGTHYVRAAICLTCRFLGETSTRLRNVSMTWTYEPNEPVMSRL